jgi:hypothetical protein
MEQHLQKIKDSYGTDFEVTFERTTLTLKLNGEEFITVNYQTLCTDSMAELLVHYIIGRVNTYIINGTGNIQQIQASVDKMLEVLKKFNKINWPPITKNPGPHAP